MHGFNPSNRKSNQEYFYSNIVNEVFEFLLERINSCLLYTSDAADERSSVDLGGRRIIKKKHLTNFSYSTHTKL